MPAYTRGKPREVVTFVAINEFLHYGWKAPDLAAAIGVSAADLAGNLGHITAVTASGVTGSILVTGANSPKPGRVTKRLRNAPLTAAGSVSTFVAYNKLSDANVDGWSLSKRARGVKLTASTANKRQISAIATLSNGLKYVFSMNKTDFTTYGAELGLQTAEQMSTAAETKRLATGCRTKPGVASKEVGTGTFSSFYSTASLDAVAGAGYNIETEEVIEYQ